MNLTVSEYLDKLVRHISIERRGIYSLADVEEELGVRKKYLYEMKSKEILGLKIRRKIVEKYPTFDPNCAATLMMGYGWGMD